MYIGFDVGGSFIKAVLAENKKIIKNKQLERPDNLPALLDTLASMVEEFKKGAIIQGIGFGFAGALDKKREAMLKSPNIPILDNQPLKKILEEKFAPLPVLIQHDVHCFLLAEREIGLAKDYENVLCIALGTGIGCAWMVDGKIYPGAHGSASEAAHMIIDIEKGLDLEELASNKFIKKELGVPSYEASQKARQGDKQAIFVLKNLSLNLGVGIANFINILDPEAIIIAGGVAGARDFIEPEIKSQLGKYVISPEAKKTPILFSEENKFGGALGAAMLFK